MNKEIFAFSSMAAAVALVASPAVWAQDRSPLVFTQSGPWALDYGDDYCRLAATFAQGDDELALALERNRTENSVRLVLVGEAIKTFRNAETIGYSYLPRGDDRSAAYVRSETAEGRPYFNLGMITFGPDPAKLFAQMDQSAPPQQQAPDDASSGGLAVPPYDRAAEIEFAADVEGIALEEGLLRPITLRTGSLGAPVQALQGCMDDLLRDWGLDHESHKTMTRRAAPAEPAYEWLPANTIGFADFSKFTGARNPVRVMVDAQGNPTACHVHWPSLDEKQNTRICDAIMENGEFIPALDAEGSPMGSYWTVDPAFGLTRPFGS